ncbi:ANTAR domain-containing response regulator [Amycolatopsis sp. NPDC059021]|uniref:ANTAR domain-containing response regulator n=1 Tax=Amycolatopsis sp. NPDC059021 TaxID=3346704 RepID=UPI00366FA954
MVSGYGSDTGNEELAELERLRGLVTQLQTALDTRIVIEQAKGVLAERYQIPLPEAFIRLRKRARDQRLRLRTVAGSVLSTLPEAKTD